MYKSRRIVAVSLALAFMLPSTSLAISYEELNDIVTNGLIEEGVLMGGEEQVQVQNLRIHVPGRRGGVSKANFDQVIGDALLTLEEVQVERPYNRFSFILREYSEDELLLPKGELRVTGRYQGMLNVPMLVMDKVRGEVIQSEDIAYTSVVKNKVGSRVIKTASELVGKVAKRRLLSGRTLRASDVERKRVVKKGNMVSVTYTTQLIEVKISGKALEDGAEGDVIRIRNSKSGIIIQAKLTANGGAEVNHANAFNLNALAPGRTLMNERYRVEG